MSGLPWTPWHDVVQLRDDLKSGELTMAMFAADLYDVKVGKARDMYQQLDQFFAFTYPTLPLRHLAGSVMRRLAGKSDKAVYELALTYGGGKTHTLITLEHLAEHPHDLPDLPAAREFQGAAGMPWMQARVAVLPFDKIDLTNGLLTMDPDKNGRTLKQIWSILAYQLAGSDGLRLLHPAGLDEERGEDQPPSEETLKNLLSLPARGGYSTLVLIDEVMMFARVKVESDPRWQSLLNYFFQCLTQAATKVDTCCIVASMLATEPSMDDELGRKIRGGLEEVFNRQREELIQPVGKDDAAEVLRRRFFTPQSIRDIQTFRPHVQAALVGLARFDDYTRGHLQSEEERFLKSYPFHPDLTEIFYGKWISLDKFQRTRGVLRHFALALREAEAWDECPLVSVNVFLNKRLLSSLAPATRDLANVAETEEYEGKRQPWITILESELEKARQIQHSNPELDRHRIIEQAALATFLHSQPIGSTQLAETRDLYLLLSPAQPDRIELSKGLHDWAERSWYLDEKATSDRELGPDGFSTLPKHWRLGARPNLKQMHDDAREHVSPELIEQRREKEIRDCKSLVSGLREGVKKAFLLPKHPRDIEGKDQFFFAILGPDAASEAGQPSAEARHFLDEKNGPHNPRTERNNIILAVPSRVGLTIVEDRIKDVIGWQYVRERLQGAGQETDETRQALLRAEERKAEHELKDMICQAYCIVVTVDRNDQAVAFKVTPDNVSLFEVICQKEEARIYSGTLDARSFLPGSGSLMELFAPGQQSRPLSDLIGAFASDVRLYKLLNQVDIRNTLVDGVRRGVFVFQARRPGGTYRTYWREEPDAAVFQDPHNVDVVLVEYATLTSLVPDLLQPGQLHDLWRDSTLSLSDLAAYFSSGSFVSIEHESWSESIFLPAATHEALNAAVREAVRSGNLWLRSGRASLLGEEVPDDLLIPEAVLSLPPEAMSASALLPANLPEAWNGTVTTARSLADALSAGSGQVLPWTTVRAAIEGAITSRLLERTDDSAPWSPASSFANASDVRLQVYAPARIPAFPTPAAGSADQQFAPRPEAAVVREHQATPYSLGTSAILDDDQLWELVKTLGELHRAAVGLQWTCELRIELMDEEQQPISADVRERVNVILRRISDRLQLH